MSFDVKTIAQRRATFKPGTRQRLDGIPAAAVDSGGPDLHQPPLNQFTRPTNSGLFPIICRHSLIILRKKNAALHDLINFCPINRKSVISRLVEKVVKASSWTAL